MPKIFSFSPKGLRDGVDGVEGSHLSAGCSEGHPPRYSGITSHVKEFYFGSEF